MKLLKKFKGVSALTLLAIAGGLQATFPSLKSGHHMSEADLESMRMAIESLDCSNAKTRSNDAENSELRSQVYQEFLHSGKAKASESIDTLPAETRSN